MKKVTLSLIDARRIATFKLSWDQKFFNKCKSAADEMGVASEHMGPMVLALGIMGLAKVDKKEMEGELTDALALVAKLEKEWRLEMKETRH